MPRRVFSALVAVSLMTAAMPPAQAENKMGYRLLSAQEAATLPRGGGVLGLDIERSQQITDSSGITFDVLRVKSVRRGSPSAQVGFQAGDEIIAVDGRVFPSVAAFAAYVGSKSPGTAASFDIIPAGRGPAQAQRITVTLGTPGQAAPPPRSGGLSTGAKVAIGVGAVALFGCYKLGCFKRRAPAGAPGINRQPVPNQQFR